MLGSAHRKRKIKFLKITQTNAAFIDCCANSCVKKCRVILSQEHLRCKVSAAIFVIKAIHRMIEDELIRHAYFQSKDETGDQNSYEKQAAVFHRHGKNTF